MEYMPVGSDLASSRDGSCMWPVREDGQFQIKGLGPPRHLEFIFRCLGLLVSSEQMSLELLFMSFG